MFRPLLLITYALNYAVHGQHVAGYRWVNMVLHAGCGMLVMSLAMSMSGDRVLSGLAAVLFLLHPLHSEALNLVSARSDVLTGLLYLGVVVVVMRPERHRSSAVSGLIYAAGLLTKSMAITAPIAAAACEIARSGWRQPIRRWGLYGVLSAVAVGYLWLLTHSGFLVRSAANSPRPIWENLLTQMKVHVYYLWLFASPLKLSVDHQFFVSSHWSEPAVLLAGCLLLSLAAWAVLGRRHLLAQGYGWFVLAMLPATLVPLNILVSERRLYLASAGLVLGLGWVLRDLLRRRGRIGIAVCVAAGLLLAEMSISRNRVWANELSLWEDAVQKGPQAHRARVNLAMAYNLVGRRQEALQHLRVGLALNPGFGDAWIELGSILSSEGDLNGAEEAFQKALSLEPGLQGVHYNLGNVYQHSGRFADAASCYERALALDPDYADAHNNLGQAREATGSPADGVVHYTAALEADPELAEAWFNLAAASEKMGDVADAAVAYIRADSLARVHPEFESDPKYREIIRRAEGRLLRLKSE